MGGGYSNGGYSNAPGSQYYSNPQQPQTSSPDTSLNNPATVLSHEDDLNLTSKQVQALEKMVQSGKQHAALVLTSAQRKQLAGIVGIVRKSGSTGTRNSPSFGASSIVQSP
jgi:ATP-dependent Clp protease adapter protein ClpS